MRPLGSTASGADIAESISTQTRQTKSVQRPARKCQHERRQGVRIVVLATREGLVGKPTASGYIIDTVVPFVALPNHKALGRFIRIANTMNAKTCYAVVLEVGPWNISDPYADPAVQPQPRPQSESGIHVGANGVLVQGQTNHAGIDLGEKVWNLLGMTNNGKVDWVWLA